MEVTVGEASPFAGAQVGTARWPAGSVAVSIDRHGQLVAPTPSTELQAGDVVVIVAPASAQARVRELFTDE